MKDKKRKAKVPQEEGSPAWMNTYGDMMTLLLTFFVLIFSFSSVDAGKWQDLVNSLSGVKIIAIPALDPNAAENTDQRTEGRFVISTNKPENPLEPTPSQSADNGEKNGMNADEVKKKFNELYAKMKASVDENGLGYILNIEAINENTILLRMSDSAFFDSGSAEIDGDAKGALKEVCLIMQEYEVYIKTIRIEGHTDNVPIHTAVYEDNWALSMGRADAVRKYILGVTQLEPALLVPTYFGEYHPVASNDTPEGRTKNRRVDFVIESKLKDD